MLSTTNLPTDPNEDDSRVAPGIPDLLSEDANPMAQARLSSSTVSHLLMPHP